MANLASILTFKITRSSQLSNLTDLACVVICTCVELLKYKTIILNAVS